MGFPARVAPAMAKAMKAMTAMKAMKAMKAVKAMKATKAPAMKASKAVGRKAGTALSKGGMADALTGESGLKKAECAKILDALAELGAEQVKKVGKFVLPGLCMIKTRVKPATKAGVRVIFGKEQKVAAKPAKTVVKAFPVSSLKKAI